MARILFYIAQDYYWESLEPIYRQYADEGKHDLFIKIGKNQRRVFGIFLVSEKSIIEEKYRKHGCTVTDKSAGFDVVFLGAQAKNPEQFGNAILCNVDHGPGIKTLRYRHLLKQKNVQYHCFVEGQYRLDKFKKYGLDKIHKVYDTGLPKLDCFFDGSMDKNRIISGLGINPNKKTVLYAPSYKPTSIFLIGEEIPALSEHYNVIVKLHPYSWKGKYASHSHHRYFEKMTKKYPSIHLVSSDISDVRPYMFVADTMISDGSSVINEFLALGRCGIIVDLPDDEQTHHDGTPLLEDKSSEWLKDSFVHHKPGSDLLKSVQRALRPSQESKKALAKDKAYIFSETDGNAAKRVKSIVDLLIK